VDLEAPTKEWAARRTGPTINLYLADVREDVDRRSTGRIPVLDEEGRVTSRRLPRRWFQVTYVITAWANSAEDEHELLSSVLGTLLRYEFIPPDLGEGRLPALYANGEIVMLRPGGRVFSDRFATELWSAVGADYRPFIPLIATVPFPWGAEEPAGPPQTQPPQVRMGSGVDPDAAPVESVQGRSPGTEPTGPIRTRARQPGGGTAGGP
jgi:hypothetical protein